MVIEEEQGEFRNQKWKGNSKGLPAKIKEENIFKYLVFT